MKKFIDINCDLGEGIGNEKELLPFISSANIACGYHAGDEDTMKKTIELCLEYGIAIGAHPSFPDRANFGRTNMNLPAEELHKIMLDQIHTISNIAASFGTKLQHVKPHGALYNMAAKDFELAYTLTQSVKEIDTQLSFFGLPNSEMEKASNKSGIQFIGEAFADRTYQNDGTLTPRTNSNALIESETEAIEQVLQIIQTGTVTSVLGNKIPLRAETICIHGDGKHAVLFAESLYKKLNQNHIQIKPLR
ncbi:5-oxoprolinase subunit PxpA [Flavobacterium sp. MAHUQ-51]|uniref:5-oxoprolinase subunit PxpA n=1 Tax=Flavobacterium sp. GCM10022190 TaxID=3252639 RepID=UPI00361FECCD